MAAIEADTSLLLFLVGQPFMGGRIAGALDLKRLDVGQPSECGLTLTLEPRPSQTDPPADARLVWLRAWIESTATRPRVYGRIDIEPSERVQFAPNAPTARWVWILLPEDVEAIERDRAAYAANPLSLRLRAEGAAVLDGTTWGFAGDLPFRIPAPEWVGLLDRLGYATAPSLVAIAGPSVVGDLTWADAEGRLAEARRFLRLGESREALEAAYHAFDEVARNPYRATWRMFVAGMPAEKADAVRDLLRAHATCLNKLGRHPATTRDETQDRPRLPVDQWEAELGVATSQLLLTHALRLRALAAPDSRSRRPRVRSPRSSAKRE